MQFYWNQESKEVPWEGKEDRQQRALNAGKMALSFALCLYAFISTLAESDLRCLTSVCRSWATRLCAGKWLDWSLYRKMNLDTYT